GDLSCHFPFRHSICNHRPPATPGPPANCPEEVTGRLNQASSHVTRAGATVASIDSGAKLKNITHCIPKPGDWRSWDRTHPIRGIQDRADLATERRLDFGHFPAATPPAMRKGLPFRGLPLLLFLAATPPRSA